MDTSLVRAIRWPWSSRQSLTVTVLDVGHGNATLIRDTKGALLVDTGSANGAGSSGYLLDYLRVNSVTHIDCVILSHADEDHIGGLLGLLGSGTVTVGTVMLNSDGTKHTTSWANLIYELESQEEEGRLTIGERLRKGTVVRTRVRGVTVNVLAPRLALTRLGVGNLDKSRKRILTNTISAVLLVKVDGRPLILLPGDMDALGFDHLIESKPDLRAPYLVMPHHGGAAHSSSSRTAEMTEQLCSAVDPQQIFISNGRGKHGHPDPVVVGAILKSSSAPIACTQLAVACGADASRGTPCAGEIRLTRKDGIGVLRDGRSHSAFVDSLPTQPLCRRPAEPVRALIAHEVPLR